MTSQTPIVHRMRIALEANAAAYRRAVQTSAPGDCWDYVVLTAANEKQAHGYRQELALRHRAVGPAGAFFPAIQKSLVVPDPPSRRAGSGGATLGVMRALADQFHLSPDDLKNQRILLIHSGGASQRLPAYSPLGKIFAPLPLLRPDGQISTLFDHLYLTLAGLPERLGPGMLILAGDVFLLFDYRHVHTPPPGVTALTMRVEADLGRGHGIFITDASSRILQTLQKAPVETMRQAGALDDNGQVLIDTGLLFFDPDRTALLAHLAGIANHPTASPRRGKAQRRPGSPAGLQDRFPQQIDLYEDMTAALAASTNPTDYLRNPATAALRKELWKHLHNIPFQTMQLDGQFLHLGTTRQFRDAMVGHNPSPAAELFQQNVLAHGAWPIDTGRRVYHSALLGASGTLGPSTVVEHSILGPSSRIGAGSVVSQVLAIQNPINLPDNCLLFQVPVRTKPADLLYVHVLCGVEDDFKGLYPNCLFLNQPIAQFLKRHHLTPRDIWPDVPADRRTLWTAKLFVGTPQRDATNVVNWFTLSTKAPQAALKQWRQSPRFSMAMLLEQADPEALIAHRETVAAYLQTGALLESLRNGDDKPMDSFIGHYASPAAYQASLHRLLEFASAPDTSSPLHQARAYWCAAQLLQRPDHPTADSRPQADHCMALAFSKIAEATEVSRPSPSPGTRRGKPCVRPLSPLLSPPSPLPPPPHFVPSCLRASVPSSHIPPGLRIEAASPVRLDLAGGWTDTPPYCYERGGQVINLAINLDNQPPVRAMVRTLREPVLILESNDLGTHVELSATEPLGQKVDVHDPFALHKVALDIVGLLPASHANLQSHLKKLGAGLIVSTECRVPKGSGLGTSSILAATLLAALYETINRPATTDQLIAQTLLLEQRLSTGGGWQDQVGGIVGGVKSTTTTPGIPQVPLVEPLPLSDELYTALQDRFVVYYSGQQRLARDILRRVMGRYLAREPAILFLMEDLKKSAQSLRQALLKGNWPAAAREMARYWEIKKQLYPGSTTPTIDVLFLELREHYLAAGLAGAGGGGFSYFFCKDARQANRLRDRLAALSSRPGSLGTLFQTQINRTGLAVTRKST